MVINTLTYAINMCGHIHVCIKPSTKVCALSNNNNNYILDIVPFNIKMIKRALHEFKNINVYK